MSDSALRHPLLEGLGLVHGFGLRGAPEPVGLLRPRQVHGARVVRARDCADAEVPADAVLASEAGTCVGVVTADCVPLLIAADGGRVVAAVHAGWRGLAAGVVEAAVAAVCAEAHEPVAVIGPHAGACCYEVDAPVLRSLRPRFGEELERAGQPTSPGHVLLDLGRLAHGALRAAGVAASSIGRIARACTICDATRFHSYRRDGPRAGRLVHFIRSSHREP